MADWHKITKKFATIGEEKIFINPINIFQASSTSESVIKIFITVKLLFFNETGSYLT